MTKNTNFIEALHLFIDRMDYVGTQYDRILEGKKSDIGMGKTVGQYFFTFMQSFIEECKNNNVDPNDRTAVMIHFDQFDRELSVRSFGGEYRQNKINEEGEMILTEEDKKLCDIY